MNDLGWLLSPSVEYFVDEPLGTDEVRIFQARCFGRHTELYRPLVVPFALDAVIHQSYEASSNNCTAKVNHMTVRQDRKGTHSPASVKPPRTAGSLIHIEHGETQPAIDCSSTAADEVMGSGTMWATAREELDSNK